MKRTFQAASTHTHKTLRSGLSRQSAWLALAGLICLAALAWPSVWRSVSAQSGFNISTIAGSSGGTGPFADFQNARGIAVASADEMYFADTNNHVIRKLNLTAGTLTVFAGKAGQAAGNSVATNGDGGAATDALLNSPSDVAVDANGDVYISDSGNRRIRKVALSNRQINTVAGNGLPGSSLGDPLAAVLTDPRGIALDGTRLLIADAGNHRLIAINDLGGTPGISHVAGNGAAGNEGDGGPASIAALSSPNDVAVDGITIYIADTGNHVVRAIISGNISTFAGNGLTGSPTEFGVATSVQLNNPTGVTVGPSHKVLISDTGNNRVRQVDGTSLTTIAGRAGQGYNGDGTPATLFTLNAPSGIGVSGSDVFFLDAGNGRLRKVSGSTISTVASDGSSGFAGDTGLANLAKLDGPMGVALDAAGNYYIADTNNHVIRKVNASDGKINTIAGTANTPSANPGDANGDGGPALAATFNRPSAVAVDASGNIFVADTGNNRVRKIDTNGNISTLAGLSSPLLNGPSSVAVFGTTLYIADPGNHVVRQVPVGGGTVTIFAGTQGTLGFTGDNGTATGARLNRPSGVAVNTDGDVFIADTNNHRIRRVSGGVIGTAVTQGIPRTGFEGDGGPANTARLNSPSAVAVDSSGNLYIVDKGNNRIRRVTAATNIINTVIGNGEIGFGGDGGPATVAKLSLANGVAVNASGVYVADTGNNRIRLAVAPPNSAPNLTSPGDKTVSEGSNLSLTLQATDPNTNQTLTYSMTGAPNGATLNATTGAFSYTPAYDVVPNNAGATQTFNITFTVTDDATPPLSNAKAIVLTVNNVNRAPIADSGTLPATVEATGPSGASVQLNGTASDPDGDAITSTIWSDNFSGGTNTIASQLTAQVTLALGQHLILLTVSDGKPNGTTSTVAKNVKVQDTTPPVFSNVPADITQTIASGTGTVVTFALPTATDTVSGNRTVTASPASGSTFPVGTTTVTFSASDAAGNPASTTFKVTVNCTGCNPPPPPTGSNFNIAAFAGNGSFGSSGNGGNGAAATAATFKQPNGIAADANGNVYIADAEARVIRKVSGGTITLLAGTGAKGFAGDGGAATSAKFNNPNGLALHAASNSLYVADTGNHRIRKIDLSNNTISTIAGAGIAALGGTGPAISAWINSPTAVAVDAAGNVYFADTGNNRVCKVSSGNLSIVAGTGEVGNSGDGATALSAKMNHPTGVAVSSDGATLYIADQGNNRIRKVAGGNIAHFAGLSNGTSGFGGDGAAANLAQLNAPTGLALDSNGNLIITDTDNERLRKVTISDGLIVTIAGSNSAGNTGDSGTATSATLDTPTKVAIDGSGNIVFSDSGNLRVRRLTASGPANNLPVPAQVVNQSLNKSQQLSVALSATDVDNDSVTFSLVPSLPFVTVTNANATARTATLFINPAGGNVGVYSVQVKAEDSKGGSNLTPSFTITVSDPNGPPANQPPVAVANALPSTVQANGQTATVNLDGTGSSDPNNDPLTFSWTDNGQVIATTAQASVQLAVGTHSIVLTVNDGKGGTASTAAQSVTVTEAPTGGDPVITSLTPTSGKRGTTVFVTINGSGFLPGQTVVTVNGGAVTVTPTSITSTTIVAKFVIASSAQTSTRNVTVTNPGGVSFTKSGAFTIQP